MPSPSQSRLALLGIGLLCAVPLGAFVSSGAIQEPLPERKVSKPERNISVAIESSSRPPLATTFQTRDSAAPAISLEEEEVSSTSTEEQAVIEELRRLAFTRPKKSLALARSALQKSPNGATVDELRWYEARALVSLGQFADARKVAERMLEHHPQSPFTADAQRHLLSHPFGLPPR